MARVAGKSVGTSSAPIVTAEDLARLRMVLGRLGRVIRQQSDDEVTHSQVSLLFNIRRMQPVTAGDVAVAEGVTPPSITRSLTRLAERGFVVRKAHPGDGRAMLVSLTRKGEEECNRVLRIRDVWLHERLMDLNQEEIDHLLETLPLLERLCDPALSLSSQ